MRGTVHGHQSPKRGLDMHERVQCRPGVRCNRTQSTTSLPPPPPPLLQMAFDLFGRWAAAGIGTFEIIPADGAKVLGKWWGSKGGPAGFVGRLVGHKATAREIRGTWFDVDSGVIERDNLPIVLTLGSPTELTIRQTAKGGSDNVITATRPIVERSDGKITAFSFRRRDIFDRLTSAATLSEREARAEAQRAELLATSIKVRLCDYNPTPRRLPALPGGPCNGTAPARSPQLCSCSLVDKLQLPDKPRDPAVFTIPPRFLTGTSCSVSPPPIAFPRTRHA